jgi:hypothetical protein
MVRSTRDSDVHQDILSEMGSLGTVSERDAKGVPKAGCMEDCRAFGRNRGRIVSGSGIAAGGLPNVGHFDGTEECRIFGEDGDPES